MINLPFMQAWLPEPEPEFEPGTAEISWRDGKLHLLADLADDEVITSASAHQQRLWEMGDVVELFIQRAGEECYDEYQISPNGMTLALRYPDISCVEGVRKGTRRIEEFFSELLAETSTWKTNLGWGVSISVPLAYCQGDRVRLSCGHYDAASGRIPIISSTSPHLVRDFHRPQDWREIILVEG